MTLIEAMVVVAVTAMVGAIAFPELRQGLAGAAFTQALSGVRADLRMARAQAISTSEPVEIEVDRDGRGYGWTPGPRRGLVAGLRLLTQGELRFYPDGSSSSGAVELTNGRARAGFTLDPVSGLVGTTS